MWKTVNKLSTTTVMNLKPVNDLNETGHLFLSAHRYFSALTLQEAGGELSFNDTLT